LEKARDSTQQWGGYRKGMHAAEKRQGERSADAGEKSRAKEGNRTNDRHDDRGGVLFT
jgi:hypothetical protein